MSEDSMKVRVCVGLVILCVGGFLMFALLTVQSTLTSDKAYAQNLIRLHVVAHSNLPKDQDLKLVVRDAVLQETRDILGDTVSKEQANNMLVMHQENLQEVAQEVVRSQGFDYPVQVTIGHFAFPHRDYETLTLPEGFYDAVRIEIGNAVGDNWWCVLFPPLCLGELSDADSNLVKVHDEGTEGTFVFRSKLWEHVSQTRYAQTLQKWWQASAAGFPTIVD